MWKAPDNDCFADEIHLAGELVPPGTYRQVATGRTIRLDREDRLPGSLDGRVACYVAVRGPWEQAEEPKRRDKCAA